MWVDLIFFGGGGVECAMCELILLEGVGNMIKTLYCRRMAAIGSNGQYTNHLHRDLLRMEGAKGTTQKGFHNHF